ncbi:unnamed protein product [Dicrocoelium dendriticum]|nr:unnamed protein product [Dicrocoelium dendriticum]
MKRLHDFRWDLENVKTWLLMLQPYLPDTAAWMSSVNNMSNSELRSASKFYQASLMEVEKHAKTLSDVIRAVRTLKSAPDLDTAIFMRVTQMEGLVLELESACHLRWLHLLELTMCIDRTYFPSLNLPAQLFHSVNENGQANCARSSPSMDSSPLHSDAKPSNKLTYNPFNIVFNPFDEDIPDLPLSDSVVAGPRPWSSLTCGPGSAYSSGSGPPLLFVHSSLNVHPEHEMRFPTSGSVPVSKTQMSGAAVSGENYLPSSLAIFPDLSRDKVLGFSNRSNDSHYESEPEQQLKSTFSSTVTPVMSLANWGKAPFHHSSCACSQNCCANKSTRSLDHLAIDMPLRTCSSSPCFFNSFDTTSMERHKKANNPTASCPFLAPSHAFVNHLHLRGHMQLNSDIHRSHIYATEQISTEINVPTGQQRNFFRETYHSSSQPSLLSSRLATRLRMPTRKNKSTETVRHSGSHSRHKRGRCAHLSVWKHTSLNSSSESSVDGDASDLERRRWTTRVRYYLDAATHAEELVRRQQLSTDLRAWLNTLGPTLFARTSPHIRKSSIAAHEREVLVRQNSEDQDLSVISHAPGGSAAPNPISLDTLKREASQEHLMSYWDDYQVPLYSSSSEADTHEPVGVFAEEFPWDDVGDSCASDVGVLDPALPDSSRDAKLACEEYVPFRSPLTTMAQADNSDEHIPDISIGYKQDTMDLSTTTSVLFNQKSSSVDASFEVCSPSVVTTASQTRDFDLTDATDRVDFARFPQGLRTHPDGGSQLKIDNDPTHHLLANNHTQRESGFFFSSSDHVPSCAEFKLRGKCFSFPRCRRQCLGLSSQLPNGECFNRHRSSCIVTDRIFPQSNPSCTYHDILDRSRTRLRKLANNLYQFINLRSRSNRCVIKSHISSHSDWNTAITQWQNELSRLIHLAEAELSLLHGSAGDWNDPRTTLNHCPSTSPADSSPYFPTHPTAQSDWVKLIDEARRWLLRSCSDESIRQRLQSLRSRLTDATEFVQSLPPVSSSMGEGCTVEGRSSSHEPFDSRELAYTVTRLESIIEQLDRLHSVLDRRLTMLAESAHTTSMPDVVVLFAANNADLRQQLDELQADACVVRKQLSERLTLSTSSNQLIKLGKPLCDMEQNCQTKCHEWEDLSADTVVHAKNLVHSSTQFVTPPISPKISHFARLIFMTSGIFVSACCCCCYLLAHFLPCNNLSQDWPSPVHIFEQLLHPFFTDMDSTCPLKREGVATFVDLTHGPVPF